MLEKDFLLQYVQNIALELSKYCNDEWVLTEKDITNIKKLSTTRIKKMWNLISTPENFENENLQGVNCLKGIFCEIFKSDCSKCIYGKTHGICNKEDSDYQKMIAEFKKRNINLQDFPRLVFLKDYSDLLRKRFVRYQNQL